MARKRGVGVCLAFRNEKRKKELNIVFNHNFKADKRHEILFELNIGGIGFGLQFLQHHVFRGRHRD